MELGGEWPGLGGRGMAAQDLAETGIVVGDVLGAQRPTLDIGPAQDATGPLEKGSSLTTPAWGWA